MSKIEATTRLRHYRRFFVVYAIITISIAIVAYFMMLFLKEQKESSLLINIAGRERMLLQKMTKEVLLFYSFDQDKQTIYDTISIFEESMQGLLYGGEVRRITIRTDKVYIAKIDEDIQQGLQEISSAWEGYKIHMNHVIENKDEKSMQYLITHNAQLLHEIDAFVTVLQEHYERRALRMRTVAIVLSSLVIFGFALTILFQIRGIVAARRALEDIESFVPICSRCKKIRKENANPRDPASWMTIEVYFKKKSDTDFSHGLCPDCIRALYPDIADKMFDNEGKVL